MESIDIESIINLDEKNMKKYFQNSNFIFDRNKRRLGIENEINNGAIFITVFKNGNISGYLEFIEDENGTAKFPSIQLDQSNSHPIILRTFADKILNILQNRLPKKILSNAHNSNLKSIQFHKKIGFKEIGEKAERIIFEIEGLELYNKICSLYGVKKL